MPNIEIFGLQGEDEKQFKKIYEVIESSLDENELRDVVFTYHDSIVLNIERKKSPFIRITDTDRDRAKRLANLCSKLIDVEILILDGFISCNK